MMPAELRLLRVRGPDDAGVKQQYVRKTDSQIGRAVESDICLPDQSVSRRHAALLLREGDWYLVDNTSKSGTFFNGQRLAPATPVKIRVGDELNIGPWVFRAQDADTLTHTIDLAQEEAGGLIESPDTSRRLDALSNYIAALTNARSREALGLATLEAALACTGFRRGALLALPSGPGIAPELLIAREACSPGVYTNLGPTDIVASRSLVARACAGEVACHSASAMTGPAEQSQSLVDASVLAALCVPIIHNGVVSELLYLDTNGGSPCAESAAGHCEDIATLHALAHSLSTTSDLSERQQALRIELEHARELREVLTAPPQRSARCFRYAQRGIAGLFVSADFFDVLEHDDGSMHVIFGDASGHGVGASMLSTLLHSHLVALLGAGLGVPAAVGMTNQFLVDRALGGRFASLIVLHMMPDGRAEVIDAGHGHWIHRTSNGVYMPPTACHVPIGVAPHTVFEPVMLCFRPEDRFILYTDGVAEQEDANGRQFGVSGLQQALSASRSCTDDIELAFSALMAHADGQAIADDSTIASIEMLSSATDE